MNINEINEAFDREYEIHSKDPVYRIIRACGLSTANSDINVFALEKIIEDIKAAEREACAQLCLEQDEYGCGQYARAIRARGNPQRPVKSYTNNSPQYATDDRYTKQQNVYTSEERVHGIDIRKAAEMALQALCSANPIGHALEDYAYHNKATEALRQALAQPEQEKESTAQTVDPRLLLGRSNNFNKETENRLCDIERRLAAIETQPAPPREKNNG